MIGLDTNVLLRFFLRDDEVQSGKVFDLFSRLPEIGPGYINCISLMEFAWFLRSRVKLSRGQIMEAISDLLDSEDLMLEDEHIVEETLAEMAESSAEFADLFISLRNRKAGCLSTKTFDISAAKFIPGMELLQ